MSLVAEGGRMEHAETSTWSWRWGVLVGAWVRIRRWVDQRSHGACLCATSWHEPSCADACGAAQNLARAMPHFLPFPFFPVSASPASPPSGVAALWPPRLLLVRPACGCRDGMTRLASFPPSPPPADQRSTAGAPVDAAGGGPARRCRGHPSL